jgi:hypothetical protein
MKETYKGCDILATAYGYQITGAVTCTVNALDQPVPGPANAVLTNLQRAKQRIDDNG